MLHTLSALPLIDTMQREVNFPEGLAIHSESCPTHQKSWEPRISLSSKVLPLKVYCPRSYLDFQPILSPAWDLQAQGLLSRALY